MQDAKRSFWVVFSFLLIDFSWKTSLQKKNPIIEDCFNDFWGDFSMWFFGFFYDACDWERMVYIREGGIVCFGFYEVLHLCKDLKE